MFGTIERYFLSRGYGFIRADDGREAWFHRRDVLNMARRAPLVETVVQFDCYENDDGRWRATNVVRVSLVADPQQVGEAMR